MKGLLPLTAVLFAVVAQPAAAAFPGTNGQIAIERQRAGGAAIATVNGDGTGDRDGVIDIGPRDGDPSWSPDGRRLAFTSTRDGNEEIYVWDTDTGALTRLTFDPARDRDPAWSPDGTRLASAASATATRSSTSCPPPAEPPGSRRPCGRPAAGLVARPARSPSPGNRRNSTSTSMDDNGAGVRRVTQEPRPDPIRPGPRPATGSLTSTPHDSGGYDVHAIDRTGRTRAPSRTGPLTSTPRLVARRHAHRLRDRLSARPAGLGHALQRAASPASPPRSAVAPNQTGRRCLRPSPARTSAGRSRSRRSTRGCSWRRRRRRRPPRAH